MVEVAGGVDAAQLVADAEGFILLGQVLPDSDLYHFKHKHINKRSTDHAERKLKISSQVKSFTQQRALKVR